VSAGMKFPSRIDGWLIPVMVIAFAGIIISLVAVMVTPTPWPVRAFTTVAMVLVTFLLFAVLRNTYYAVDTDELRVVSGPFRWKIPLSEITDIRPTRNPLSSPALSMDRLKVSYGKRKSVLISPADKDGFLRAIRQAGVRHE
jgi:membrane protein YdbS with pleckstrin-like domain